MEPVQIDRFYLGCLAHESYAVSSEQLASLRASAFEANGLSC